MKRRGEGRRVRDAFKVGGHSNTLPSIEGKSIHSTNIHNFTPSLEHECEHCPQMPTLKLGQKKPCNLECNLPKVTSSSVLSKK